MKRAKAKRPAPKAKRAPAIPGTVLNEIEVATIRLRRAQDVLSCLAFAADEGAELDLGPVAIAARDLIDKALESIQAIAPSTQGGAS